jgi:hypothetical protein
VCSKPRVEVDENEYGVDVSRATGVEKARSCVLDVLFSDGRGVTLTQEGVARILLQGVVCNSREVLNRSWKIVWLVREFCNGGSRISCDRLTIILSIFGDCQSY